jgi:fatty acid desaturase
MALAISLDPDVVAGNPTDVRTRTLRIDGDLTTVDIRALALDLRALRRELLADVGPADLAHGQRLARWGRACSALGYATAWIAPNPVSALLLAQGNFARWTLVMHPISHRAYDRIPSAPKNWTSRYFAKGWRRFIDWFDWITPESWHEEHDVVHHYNLSEPEDPDQVEINLSWLRGSNLPMPLRYAIVAGFAAIWKPAYYAPSTLKELRAAIDRRNGASGKRPGLLAWGTWLPLGQAGRELWARCYLPYAGFKFVLLPALFAPLGAVAAWNVMINSLLAEALANIISFVMIVPNHTGEDLPRFEEPVKDSDDFFLRQILASVNYKTGTPLINFLHGYLNYHIEHHLFPDLPLRQYELAQSRVKAICKKHGVPYREESVFKRTRMAVEVMVGKTSLRPPMGRDPSAVPGT